MPEEPMDDLRRLLAQAAEVAKSVGYNVSAVDLYRKAATISESYIPAPIGGAIAGVLQYEAHEREASGMRGSLGANMPMISLALSVLGVVLGDVDLSRPDESRDDPLRADERPPSPHAPPGTDGTSAR